MQKVVGPLAVIVGIAGAGLTLIVTAFVFEQLFPFVPVTVYVMVEVGVAETFAPVVELRLVAGDQTYVLAPLAESVVGEPPQIVVRFAEAITVGNEFTVTFTEEVDEQPIASVTVTA